MIIGVFLVPRVRVSGRNRADFQNFACKIARFSTANLRNFGAERARMTQEKRADSFQRLSLPCHAIKRTLIFLQALGACCVQKLRQNSLKFRDFNRKSRCLNAQFRAAKHH